MSTSPVTPLHWIDTPASPSAGFTWGTPWPRGTVAAGSAFALRASDGGEVPVQSWTTAVWPDGSVKWSAHSAVADDDTESLELIVDEEPASPATPVSVSDNDDAVIVDTGVIVATIPRSGTSIIRELERGGRLVASRGRLVSELAHHPHGRDRRPFEGEIDSVAVERQGPVQVVLLITGRHTDGARRWLPFRLRLYFTAGSDRIRAVHSMVWDGDASTDFLCALGLTFDVPLDAPLHDRHIRIAGSSGFLTESVRPVTGLWKDPGADVRAAQIAGSATPPIDEWTPVPDGLDNIRSGWDGLLGHIPAWSDWTLSQLSADGYTSRKRTGEDYGWVTIPSGGRARGYAYLGQPTGGLELGLRGFWQSHPTQIDVRDAASDVGTLTVWMWSPEAQPMDVRFYHAGVNEQTLEGQRETVGLTYEDYKPGYGDAHGVGRTHELSLRVTDSTPSHEDLDRRAAENEAPPQLACTPGRLHAAGVFGDWDLPDHSHPDSAAIEQRLDLLVTYLADQVEDRRWYGFWDYGDVMHSYDRDRDAWRYDIGGYAWDNSELSTDLWLWLSFLRSGDARTYRFAEAMTRHTGEVDVYHVGRFAGLGTRHNVQHWGCSCKQLRVSNPYYRRFLYYLTADERIGDLLDEVAVTDSTFIELDRNRNIGSRQALHETDPRSLEVDLGIDYGAMLASWLTAWERTGDTHARQRIIDTLTDVGSMANGYFTGIAHFNLETGHFDRDEDRVVVSHLSAVFGIVEALSEILDLLDLPEFERAWLQYCRLYLAPVEQQRAEVSASWAPALRQGHTRLRAWAAHRTGDDALAQAAWRDFLHGTADRWNLQELDPADAVSLVSDPRVAEAVRVIPRFTTNDGAQYGLAAIQNLALIRSALDAVSPNPTSTGSPG